MRNIPTLFYATGAILVLTGMLWGIEMSISQDHSMAPAHAHLNLVGFVAMTLYGTFYALSPRAAASRLAMAHYALTLVAVAVFVPGIALAISENGETLAKGGSVLVVLSMALFLYMILRFGVGVAASDRAQGSVRPAE